MVSQIKKEFNLVLPLVDVFKNPTIESLSKYIKQAALDIIIGNDDRLILLKPGVNSDKHLFFIHDGTGQVDGYIECCNHLTHRLNYWGIRAEPLRHLEPCNRTIEELAREYIEKLKKVQPHGPYFIAGWSLGGTIAFEMVGQLEETGEKILFLGLIDAPGPQKDEQKNIIEFNLESEKELILGFFPESPGNHTLKEKLNHVGDSSGTWAAVVSWLEENQVSVEFIKKLIPGDLAQTIPGYGLLGIKELIDYLNTWRTLTNARARYIPSKKVTTTLHYFKASGSAGGGLECWKDYCAGSIRSYEIMGDHFSILKEPGVDEVAKKVDIIFHEMV